MASASDLLLKMVADSKRAVVTEFDLFVFARKLFRDRRYAGVALPARNGAFTTKRARQLIYQSTFDMSRFGGGITGNDLPRDWDFRSVVFVAADGDAAQVMLEADPICVISHASALAFHGLAIPPAAPNHQTPFRCGGGKVGLRQNRHSEVRQLVGRKAPLSAVAGPKLLSRNRRFPARELLSSAYTLGIGFGQESSPSKIDQLRSFIEP